MRTSTWGLAALVTGIAACGGPQPQPMCQGCVQGTTCIPITTSVSSSTTCGFAGSACVACVSGQVCQSGQCVNVTGAGGGSAGGVAGGSRVWRASSRLA